MPAQTHRLEIAGQHVTVRSSADRAYVQRLAEGLDARVRVASEQGAGPVGALLVASLALADELHRAQETVTTLRQSLADQRAQLVARVEQALNDEP